MDQKTLYSPAFEHDACGIGGVVQIKGIRSHECVEDALSIVEKLEHRAGKDATGQTGDGVGIIIQVPTAFLNAAVVEEGLVPPAGTADQGTKSPAETDAAPLGADGDVGVGMFFFPQDANARQLLMHRLEAICRRRGVPFVTWRPVPVNPQVLGEKALACMPAIYQALVTRPDGVEPGLAFDRLLYIVRREFEQSAQDCYVASFSSRTVVYKGMFLVQQLRQFYLDLQDPRCESAIALVHSRFSTNTNPSWERAHPNRVLCHNGEINTIRGNQDRMNAREETMSSPVFEDYMECVMPVINAEGSDSAMLDNSLEFLMYNGVELPKAVMMLVPEPWSKNTNISTARRNMFHYYATMMEPWDGPAALLFTDGQVMGAALDRNGLRPARYYLTDDDRLILSSEVGVLDIPDESIVAKSRLEPGRMLVVDTVAGTVLDDDAIKERYAAEHPYGEWLDCQLIKLDELPQPKQALAHYEHEELLRLCRAFGYSYEDVYQVLLPMARTGAEPTAAMGIDTPLAVLDQAERPLFDYFKQMFAQVTNPPIDSTRESIVTDTTVYVGSDGNLLEDRAENCHLLQIDSPILTELELEKIKALDLPNLKSQVISLLYYPNTPLDTVLDRLFLNIEKAYHNGANVIILSDRGVDESHLPIPSLLAVSAVEQYLVRTKKRTAISVVLESAEPTCVHHFATLLGYGARAVCPYLAHQCIRQLTQRGALDHDPYVAVADYNRAVLNGVVKVSAKMGISALQSYQSAQIFEILGLSQDVVDQYFTNTASRIGGIGLGEIGALVAKRHAAAFDPLGLAEDLTLPTAGDHKMSSAAEARDHMLNPLTIRLLQHAARTGDYQAFKQYSALIDDEQRPHTLRGLLSFNPEGCQPIDLDQVEPAESIVKRFKTGAMSYGSISQEAHECLAVAMNRLGGKSNSGEGGEDPARLGTERGSAIKQVASGRFGVTSEYLVSAQEIQIKMAQGAKPGEGGHLPGGKVWPWIAKTRYSTPGVSLISPPPHHDIYSIEDLAELIYDLKNANKDAAIAVKLVSEAGVGTIAAGVAKAGAQTVLVSGYDGGTGAAPRSSISSAGLPWELGVAEVNQTLIMNGLRSHVRIEADGKLLTGRDVAVAAILGAEEFGFATAPLIAMGCDMMRVCNLDTCPVGIATQNPELRKNFTGKPEDVVNFMLFIAEEVREILASFGMRTLDELVGRTDLLKADRTKPGSRSEGVMLDRILARASDEPVLFDPACSYDFKLEQTLDAQHLLPVLGEPRKRSKKSGAKSTPPSPVTAGPIPISSTDRACGTLFGAEVTRRFGTSLEPDTFHFTLQGGAGQSFGAFLPKGVTLELEGDSNDYLGKGLSGGQIVAYPPKGSTRAAEDNVLVGNVALYGATSGRAFINGRAGERFCVRNSGAIAVVEGVGDHGCEYMTGGIAVILGSTGRNFAAGMSGGVAYVLDPDHDLYLRTNKQLVAIEQVTSPDDVQTLRELIEEHARLTGSALANRLLQDFDGHLGDFKKVIPHAYRHMTELIDRNLRQGMAADDAATKAFLERGE
ncbi:MAG: glutamate synthase large subunit [Coriobacteriia bacterium]|nr:glutamate synthase large subunit [Coriobacteriia bacterium]